MRDHQAQFPITSDSGFDRGVIFLDDAEGTFNYSPYGTGGDDVHAYATAAAFSGTNGIRLKTRVTGAAQGDTLGIQKNLPYPSSNLVVARFRFSIPDVSAKDYFLFGMEFSALNNAWILEFKYDPNAGKLYYQDSGGSYVELTDFAHAMIDGSWSIFECVFDVATFSYLSAMINGIEGSINITDAFDGGAATGRYTNAYWLIATAGAAPTEMYIDSVYFGEYLGV